MNVVLTPKTLTTGVACTLIAFGLGVFMAPLFRGKMAADLATSGEANRNLKELGKEDAEFQLTGEDKDLAVNSPANAANWLDKLRSTKNPKDALKLFKKARADHASGKNRELEMRLIARLIGASDPKLILGELDFSDPRRGAAPWEVETLKAWAMRQPASAYKWLHGIPPGTARQQMYAAVAAGVTWREPDKGLEFVAKASTDYAFRESGKEWVTSLAETNKLGDYNQRFLDELLMEPDKRKISADPETFNKLYMMYQGRIAESDPEQAGRMLEAAGKDALIGEAMAPGSQQVREIVNGWCAGDINQLGNWLTKNPQTPFYDALVEAYVGRVSPMDVEAAQQWAATLRDPGLREKTLARYAPPPSTPKQPVAGGAK